jgi:hypothetical protein
MPASSDDDLFTDFVNTVNDDEELKRQFVAALRAKDSAGLRQAIRWVLDNLIRPAARAVRDRAVQTILNALGV